MGSYLRFLAPAAAEAFQMAYVLPLVVEAAFCIWLLGGGVAVRREKVPPHGASLAAPS